MSRRPRLPFAAAGTLAAVAAATAAFLAAPRVEAAPTVQLQPVDEIESPIEAQVDVLRRDARLPFTRRSQQLNEAAEAHAEMLGRSGTFTHHAPGERAFSTRLQRFYPSRGFAYWATGENIFWAHTRVSPEQVIRAWLASPPHKLNMLDPTWNEVGIAALRVQNAPGVYGGGDVTIVVIEFGRRHR
jgi:uncharacterized protein YkwD